MKKNYKLFVLCITLISSLFISCGKKDNNGESAGESILSNSKDFSGSWIIGTWDFNYDSEINGVKQSLYGTYEILGLYNSSTVNVTLHSGDIKNEYTISLQDFRSDLDTNIEGMKDFEPLLNYVNQDNVKYSGSPYFTVNKDKGIISASLDFKDTLSGDIVKTKTVYKRKTPLVQNASDLDLSKEAYIEKLYEKAKQSNNYTPEDFSSMTPSIKLYYDKNEKSDYLYLLRRYHIEDQNLINKIKNQPIIYQLLNSLLLIPDTIGERQFMGHITTNGVYANTDGITFKQNYLSTELGIADALGDTIDSLNLNKDLYLTKKDQDSSLCELYFRSSVSKFIETGYRLRPKVEDDFQEWCSYFNNYESEQKSFEDWYFEHDKNVTEEDFVAFREKYSLSKDNEFNNVELEEYIDIANRCFKQTPSITPRWTRGLDREIIPGVYEPEYVYAKRFADFFMSHTEDYPEFLKLKNTYYNRFDQLDSYRKERYDNNWGLFVLEEKDFVDDFRNASKYKGISDFLKENSIVEITENQRDLFYDSIKDMISQNERINLFDSLFRRETLELYCDYLYTFSDSNSYEISDFGNAMREKRYIVSIETQVTPGVWERIEIPINCFDGNHIF